MNLTSSRHFIHVCISGSQKQVDMEAFGPNLADVEKQIAAHNILHQAIQSYGTQLTPDSIASSVRLHVKIADGFTSGWSPEAPCSISYLTLFLKNFFFLISWSPKICTLVLSIIQLQKNNISKTHLLSDDSFKDTQGGANYKDFSRCDIFTVCSCFQEWWISVWPRQLSFPTGAVRQPQRQICQALCEFWFFFFPDIIYATKPFIKSFEGLIGVMCVCSVGELPAEAR